MWASTPALSVDGVEVQVAVERVILPSDIRNALSTPGQPKPPVEQRRMPVSMLGHGRCSLADKVQAHVHQTWLEYGPSIQQVRAANADVRHIITGMGTDIAIADHHDVLEQCLLQQPARGLPAIEAHPGCASGHVPSPQPPQFLYPLALVVPGTQHILDNALREVLHVLPCWVPWQAQAKVACQWLGSRGHR